MSNVNHPKHYNSHPSGIECIQIVRHYCFDIGNAIKYLWRQGLKKEQGIDPIQKQVEDCQKAIWCIKDHVETIDPDHKYHDNDEQEIVCICENCALLDQYNNECKRAGILIKNPKKSSCNLFQKRDGGK